MGQGRSKGTSKEGESFHMDKVSRVFIAGESEGEDGCVDDSIDLFIECFEPDDKEKKGKVFKKFFNQSYDTDAVEKISPSMRIHQGAWVVWNSQVRKDFEKIYTGKSSNQAEDVGQAKVAPGFWLKSVLIIEV